VGVVPYWLFGTPQATTVNFVLNDVDLHGHEHPFLYDYNPDYWTDIEGEKVWDDDGDSMGFRPSSILLTLKQYERDIVTGARGAFISDVATTTVTAGTLPADRWPFSFSTHKSYEYTYEVVETPMPVYSTVVTYPNQVISDAIAEDFTGILVTNTLDLKPIMFVKVDSSKQSIVSDIASFILSHSVSGQKVRNGLGVEHDSITLSTSNTVPYVIIPAQKPGVYHLKETKAPGGYNLLTQDIVVTIDESGGVTAVIGAYLLEERPLIGSEVDIYAKSFYVVNRDATELPRAGFTVFAAITLVCAMIGIIFGTVMLRPEFIGDVSLGDRFDDWYRKLE
jgi:hypothetical protein